MIPGSFAAGDRNDQIVTQRARIDAAGSVPSSSTSGERAAPVSSSPLGGLSPNASDIKRANDLAAAARAAAVALVTQPVDAARPEAIKTVSELVGIESAKATSQPEVDDRTPADAD